MFDLSFAFRALIAGGGAPEMEVSQRLMAHSKTLVGTEAYCVAAFADALEVILTFFPSLSLFLCFYISLFLSFLPSSHPETQLQITFNLYR